MECQIEPIPSTVGLTVPLTLERLRIVELYADILHYSNMVMPNRQPGSKPAFDEDGKLVGGLSALNDLVGAMLTATDTVDEVDPEDGDEESDNDDDNDEGEEQQQEEEVDEALERRGFPISSAQRKPLYESDSDVDSVEGIPISDNLFPNMDLSPGYPRTPPVPGITSSPSPSLPSPVEILAERLTSLRTSSPVPSDHRRSSIGSFSSAFATSGAKTPSIGGLSRTASSLQVSTADLFSNSINKVEEYLLPLGERIKKHYAELGILNTLLVSLSPLPVGVFKTHMFQDLFFEFPWNNLLHSTVYDVLHQVLHGPVSPGYNRNLIVHIFRDVQLPQRILDAYLSIQSSAKKKPHHGYMGHLNSIVGDILFSLDRFPEDLLVILMPLLPQPAWSEYIDGPYSELQRIENSVLGGPKPPPGLAFKGGFNDPEDDLVDTGNDGWTSQSFKRSNGGPVSKQTAYFGAADLNDFEEDLDDEEAQHFVSTTQFGWGRSSSPRLDEDQQEEWVKRSSETRRQGSHHSRDIEDSGFEDSFDNGNAFEVGFVTYFVLLPDR